MFNELNRAHALVLSALETVMPRHLTKASLIFMLLSPIIGISSVTDLDMAYAAWTLAGGIAGTGIALAWRSDGEMVRVVVGRASFALVSGMALPTLGNHYFPWLADLTKNPILLFSVGGLSALTGFLFGYAVFHLVQKRQDRLGRELLRRASGIDIGNPNDRGDAP